MEELLAKLADATESEKGESGRVGIVAGSIEFAGTPALTGEAALRTGADVVKVLTSEDILTAVASYSPNLIAKRYTGEHLSTDSASKATSLAEWGDVLVVGPGLNMPDPEAIRRILAEVDVPLVVDADAIAPALDAEFSEAVFTPDSHEVDQIVDVYGSLESFAAETDSVVVSTGSEDEILAPDERWTVDAGTAAMTVAGTGDVFAGIVGALLGRGLDRAEAARLGSWIVGTAGERAAAEYGAGLMATDVVERIPAAMN